MQNDVLLQTVAKNKVLQVDKIDNVSNNFIDYVILVNYSEQYWRPEGPNPIELDGVGTGAVAEYKVEPWPLDGSSERAWNFAHREDERNPVLTLYRGNTYKFIVDAKGHPFWIMTEPFKNKISADGSTSTIYSTGVTNNGSDYGTVTFTIPTTAPDKLLPFLIGIYLIHI